MDAPVVQPTPPPPVQPPPKPKNYSGVLITILLIVIGVLVGMELYETTFFSSLRAKYLAPTPTPTSVVTPSPAPDPTADWKTYTNSKYAYEFKCPLTSTHNIELANGNGQDKPLFQEICFENQNQVSVSVYPINSTITISQFLEGANAKEIASTTERVFLRGFDKNYFDQILSTFKFLDQTTPTPVTYTCPPNGYLDCMPGPGTKPQCSAEAMSWYKANCPNFRGGAL